MEIEIEYYEYDCGWPCTVDGCKGHITDIPISISINGIQFNIEGAESGDFPGDDKLRIKEVQSVVNELYGILTKMTLNK